MNIRGRGRDHDQLGSKSENIVSQPHATDHDDDLDFDHTSNQLHHDLDYDGPVSSTPAHNSKTHKRRFSTISSIFPVPPANMTILLHDSDDASMRLSTSPVGSIRAKSTTITLPRYLGSVSPATANFSMVTGSPGSLFLKPEHEIHLGDMVSLDLVGRVHVHDDGW
jgi:hypothetical protein